VRILVEDDSGGAEIEIWLESVSSWKQSGVMFISPLMAGAYCDYTYG
jgi:hypothetical protein